ncbi:MAG: UpxY family transcription antiterminator [Candidatus Tectomicrobia bacterium]|nr:UpxY family transcription antiterminator [Candidatus Tectomicrobia bacterium]
MSLLNDSKDFVIADLLDTPQWYAIYTKPRHEKRVDSQFIERGITHFLPLVKRLSSWKDRKKLVAFPLFPGYIFGHFPLRHKVDILKVHGVVRIVGVNGHAIPVPDEEINAVKTLIEGDLKCDPYPYLKEGMAVRVRRGVLVGVQGILIGRKNPFRLVISVNLIRQSVSLEIDIDEVEPV